MCCLQLGALLWFAYGSFQSQEFAAQLHGVLQMESISNIYSFILIWESIWIAEKATYSYSIMQCESSHGSKAASLDHSQNNSITIYGT